MNEKVDNNLEKLDPSAVKSTRIFICLKDQQIKR